MIEWDSGAIRAVNKVRDAVTKRSGSKCFRPVGERDVRIPALAGENEMEEGFQKSLRSLREIKRAMEEDIRALKSGKITKSAFQLRQEQHRGHLAELDEELQRLRKKRYVQ